VIQLVGILWGLCEVIFALARQAKRAEATSRDHGSLAALWIAIGIAIPGGIALHNLAPIALPRTFLTAVGAALIVGGFALRMVALRTLKQFFTVNVAIHSDQRIIQHGIYAYVRHPAYTGVLLSMLGFGLGLGSWASVGCMLFFPALAIAYRIRVEERALLEAFGEEYAAYARRVRRLVPGVV